MLSHAKSIAHGKSSNRLGRDLDGGSFDTGKLRVIDAISRQAAVEKESRKTSMRVGRVGRGGTADGRNSRRQRPDSRSGSRKRGRRNERSGGRRGRRPRGRRRRNGGQRTAARTTKGTGREEIRKRGERGETGENEGAGHHINLSDEAMGIPTLDVNMLGISSKVGTRRDGGVEGEGDIARLVRGGSEERGIRCEEVRVNTAKALSKRPDITNEVGSEQTAHRAERDLCRSEGATWWGRSEGSAATF